MKHVTDTDHPRQTPMRMARYTAQERREEPHPNSKALHQRPRSVKASQVPQYLRIDRGIEA
ncbi:MAG: hypothetical protein QNI90_14450 [Dinoroseobacter sp.]|nr:hypothetical protein [Dinoroseobacter sp.]